MTEEKLDKYTWEACKLQRGNFGRFISQYLRESNKLVINLDAQWGAGKTEFLKRLKVDLERHYHPVIYINSWESDFSNNPLSVVASELLIQMSKSFESPNLSSKLSTLLGKALRFSSLAAQALVLAGENQSAQNLNEASKLATSFSNEEIAKDNVPTSNEKLMNQIKNIHHEQLKAMREVKEQLSALVTMQEIIESKKLPVIVLVDELDRCRPNYAVELLEVIKHFFETDNFVFLCASDTSQLSESIKTIYGQGFDSKYYLRRFFHRTITLPKPNFQLYLSRGCLPSMEKHPSLIVTPCLKGIDEVENVFSHIISDGYNRKGAKIELRDVDQIIAKYNACLVAASHISSKVCVNAVVLFCTIVEQHINQASYSIKSTPLSINSNYKVGNLELSHFLVVQNSTCIETRSSKIKWSDGSQVDHNLNEPKLVLEAHTRIPSGYDRSVNYPLQQSLCKTLSHYENEGVKYLLANDIINLVELASFIE